MKIVKTIKGEDGKLYLYWEKILFAEAKSYVAQLIDEGVTPAANDRFVKIPTGYILNLILLDITITDKSLARKIADKFQTGESMLFSFEGLLKKTNGFYENFILRECVSQNGIDFAGIVAGFVPVWSFCAAMFNEELEQFNRAC